jgi:FKBP-type peptidyl-prolyl cis-trans isomerase
MTGNAPLSFAVRGKIATNAWDEDVEGMEIGGKHEPALRPQLGYSARCAGGVIPPNPTFVPDVDRLSV